MEHLERGPSVRDDGRLDTNVDGAVVDESPQVRIFDPGVRHEEYQVVGAVGGNDALCGGPAADAAVLQNLGVSRDIIRADRPRAGRLVYRWIGRRRPGRSVDRSVADVACEFARLRILGLCRRRSSSR